VFQIAVDNEFYNLDKAVKIIYDKGIYKVTFEVPIRLGRNKTDTYIQKQYTDLKIPKQFKKIDANLYLNFDKIIKVTFFDNYCYLTSITKKKIGTKYLNYNIKASYKNEEIEEMLKNLKEEKMNWINIKNSYINLDRVTNIFIDKLNNKLIFNFINHSTNMNNVEDIRPEHIIEIVEDTNDLIDDILSLDNWVGINNKLINLNNVYNVKVLPINDEVNKYIVFINFVSNITKERNNEKVISTEFVKCMCEDEEEVKELLEIIKVL